MLNILTTGFALSENRLSLKRKFSSMLLRKIDPLIVYVNDARYFVKASHSDILLVVSIIEDNERDIQADLKCRKVQVTVISVSRGSRGRSFQ